MLGLVSMSIGAYADEIEIPPYNDMQGKPLTPIECLTVNAYHESRGESDVANYFVMAVVAKRVLDDRHKATDFCEAVFHPKAFSWTSDGLSDRITEEGQYRRLYRLAFKFMSNIEIYLDMAEGADHYHKVGHKTNWDYSVLDYIGRIDNHEFYRWKR